MRLALFAARGAVALVWAYNGLYCKLLLGDISHLEVVSKLPFVNPAFALIPLAMLGLFELGLATWALSGWAPRQAAVVQTLTLLGMNCGGLLWAREVIPQPGAMVVQNTAFLVLVWLAAVLPVRKPVRQEEPHHGCAHA